MTMRVYTGQLFVGCGTYLGEPGAKWVALEDYERLARKYDELAANEQHAEGGANTALHALFEQRSRNTGAQS